MSHLAAALVFALASMGLASALFGPGAAPFLVTAAGLPHFILAFVFALASVQRGRPARRHIFGALALASLAACLLYARFPILDLVGAYFVIHLFRDEAHMAAQRRAGFAPAGTGAAGPGSARLLMPLALTLFAFGRLWSRRQETPIPGPGGDPSSQLTGRPLTDLALVAAAALLMAALAMLSRRRRALLEPDAAHLLGLLLVVALVAPMRSATLVLALFHYVAWLLFYGDRLRGASGAPLPAGGLLARAMTRPAPFVALMTAAHALAFAGLAAYLAYPETLAGLAAGYEFRYFPYWTIPHVTLSFTPRR